MKVLHSLYTHLKTKVQQAFLALCTTMTLSMSAMANSVTGSSSSQDVSKLKMFGSYSGTGDLSKTIWDMAAGIVVVIGLGMAGYGLFVVAGVLIGEFSEIRSGKSSFGRLVTFAIIGIGLIIFVMFLIYKALEIFGKA